MRDWLAGWLAGCWLAKLCVVCACRLAMAAKHPKHRLVPQIIRTAQDERRDPGENRGTLKLTNDDEMIRKAKGH